MEQRHYPRFQDIVSVVFRRDYCHRGTLLAYDWNGLNTQTREQKYNKFQNKTFFLHFSFQKYSHLQFFDYLCNGLGEKSRATDALAFISHLPKTPEKLLLE